VTGRRGLIAGVPFGLLAVVVLAAMASPLGAANAPRTYPRVLVVLLPGITWDDVVGGDMPTVRRLASEGETANLAVRGVIRRRLTAPEGNASIGAASRALASGPLAAGIFDADARTENGTAGQAFRRRTGVAPGAVVALTMRELQAENDAGLYKADLGVLGDSLRRAGIRAGVVANADPGRAVVPVRDAALAVVDRDGSVPCGRVGDDLLVDDATAPFGVRLDRAEVVGAFERCWTDRSVVAVEASDLRRAAAYRATVAPGRAAALTTRARTASDDLVAALLRRVDPERDAVVLVAPSPDPIQRPRLTLFALRAPGRAPGLLDSSNTRQPGYLTISDVGPTIAGLAGAPLAEGEIDGRPANPVVSGAGAAARLDRLVADEARAGFRDSMLNSVAGLFITVLLLLSGAVAFALWRDRALPRAAEVGALAMLGCLPLTYWAVLLPFADWGPAAYLAFVFGGGLGLGLLADLGRRRPLLPVSALLTAMILTTAVSVVAMSSRLQLSTVFGDSPIVAGRFSGVNNLTFAQIMAAAVLLATFAAHSLRRRGQSVGVPLGIGFAFVLLVDGLPMWGADVGGILAGLPGLALTLTLLAGWRLRLRSVVAWGLATLGAILLLGFVDLLRPSAQRSHLGRLFERIGGDGWSGLQVIVSRKLDANLDTLLHSVWRFLLLGLVLAAGYVMWKAPSRLRRLLERLPELRTGMIGFAVIAVLGFALNDSGVAVPGMMLGVLAPVMIYLLARLGGPSAAGSSRDGERTEEAESTAGTA